MTPEEQAQKLAEWLDDPPGAAPPPGLDPEVVEAVYALRPELAPAPGVTADDILGEVAAGPLADGAEVVPFPADAADGEPPAGDPPAPERRSRRWVAGTVIGTGLALAAAALLVVRVGTMPAADRAVDGTVAQEATTETEAPGPPAAEADEAPAVAGVDTDLDEEALFEDRFPDPAPVDELARADDALAGGDAVADAPAAQPTDQASRRAKTTTDDDPDRARARASATPTEQPERREERDAVADADRAWFDGDEIAGELDAAPPEPDLDAVAKAEEAPADAADTREMAPREEVTAAREKRSGGLRGLFGRNKDAEQASEPAPPPIDLDALRARAVPDDLPAGDLYRQTGHGTANVQANELANAGRYVEGANTLAPEVAPPLPEGQANAAQASQWFLLADAPSDAASMAARGLALSTANTPQRSWLLVLHGDALRAQGDQAGAEAAYREAIRLNAGREPVRSYEPTSSDRPATLGDE